MGNYGKDRDTECKCAREGKVIFTTEIEVDNNQGTLQGIQTTISKGQ